MKEKLNSVKEYWEIPSKSVSDQFKDHWVDDVGNSINDEMFKEVAEYINSKLSNVNSRNLRVLEVGCGTGRILEKLSDSRMDIDLHGLDFSVSQIDSAKRRLGDRVKLFLGDLPDFVEASRGQREETYFDVIFTHSVTQYFPENEYFETFMDACLNLLGTEGSLLLIDSPIEWHKEFMQRGTDSFMHKAKMTIKSMIPIRRKRVKESIGGVEINAPVFQGYWVRPDLAEKFLQLRKLYSLWNSNYLH